MSAKYKVNPCLFGYNSEFLTRLCVLANPNGRGFLLPINVIKMLKHTSSITLPQEQTLPSNMVAFITAPSVQVDPIQEISTLYNVDQFTACDIYETVGDDYTNEALVAAMCGIASPAYLEELKGGLSC